MRLVGRPELLLPRLELLRRPTQDDELWGLEQLLERAQQRRVRVGVALERVQGRAHRALGRVEIALLAGEMAERDQRERGDSVPGRHGFVDEWLRLVDQSFVVVGREKEAAALVLEVRKKHVGELACELKVLVAPTRLQQLEQAMSQERVVVEVRGKPGAAVLVRGLQAAVPPELGANEIDGARRRLREQ